MSTVILLPGLACDAALWRDQLPALSAHHAVRVSDVHQRHGDLPSMARALLGEFTGPLVLVGSSMGGMLALHAHREAPQRIVAMALLSSTARADTAELLALRSDAIVEFEQGRAEGVLRANAMFAFHPAHADDRAWVDDYVGQILRVGVAQLIAQNRAVMKRVDMRPWLADIRCPLLVACGDGDLLTPPEHSREIAQAVPQARLELVAGAGHLMTWEQPERVNALLLHWLDGVQPLHRAAR
ncbi:MAG: putative aminoacrylate hydrolase RutD [Burkholderiaceae bacterium]|nr:putative aminoacrylate hydrolase RutD [Burkholderiaceae bacterium]